MTPSLRPVLMKAGIFALTTLLLCGCGATVSTHVQAPALFAPRRAEVEAVLGRDALRKGPAAAAYELESWAGTDPARLTTASGLVLGLGKNQSKARTGFALMAARLAWESLERKPSPEATKAYDSALEVVLSEEGDAIAAGRLGPVQTPAGVVEVTVRYPKTGAAKPGYFDDLIVASQVSIRGFRTRAVVSGAGVAIVGARRPKPGREKEMADRPGRGITMALSALARFPSGRKAQIEILDPRETETVRIGGHTEPLAADFTAPLALSLGGVNDLMLGIRNMFNVSLGLNDAGVYLPEPFAPDRVPVLLIHGLSSTPLVWRNAVSAALADPAIRRNYQFWYAYYPTGAPVVASAALIREDFERAKKQYDPRGTAAMSRELDIVGYSMGGNIARILATDIGDRLWKQMVSVPFDEVKLDPRDRETIRQAIFWKPLPHVKTVIFVATPHRGTRMADASFAQWGRRLIRLPGNLLDMQGRFLSAISDVVKGDGPIPGRVTGIDTLSEHSPLFSAWEGLPLEKGARFYSIIGDRGRGDTPNSSDGVVGYWSSHLEGAESELIVPTGHDAQAYPGTEQEIIRILRAQVSREQPAGRRGSPQ